MKMREIAKGALKLWREALKVDPDNIVIRLPIWALTLPEHFYPIVDINWPKLHLLEEGYDKPLT
jgi:hypothetical protein